MDRKLFHIAIVLIFLQCCFGGIVVDIDNYTPDTPSLSCGTYNIAASNLTTQSFNGNDTVGVERDEILVIDAGYTYFIQVFSAVHLGAWQIGWFTGVFGYAQLQYDGADDSAVLTLSPGLNHLDLTGSLSASAFILEISSDHPAPYIIELYGQTISEYSRYNFTASKTQNNVAFDLYYIPFNLFSGNANFADINAIVLTMNVSDASVSNAIDTSVLTFATFGYEASGFAWYDCNNNTIFDNNEAKFAGANATLVQGSTLIASQLTASDGSFLFGGLLNGTYTVCVKVQGYTNTNPTTGCRTISLQNLLDATNLTYGFFQPTIVTAPPSLTVSCGSCTTTNCTGVANVVACGITPPSPTFVDSVSPGVCPKVITRTWSVTGSSSTSKQTINVTDTAAPLITTPAGNVTVNCKNPSITFASWLASLAGAVATDCNTITWKNNWNGVTPINCASNTVTFNASDPCGNINQTTATYFVTDTTAPQFVAISSSAECNKNGVDIASFNSWLSTAGGASIVDDCTVANQIKLTSNYTSGFTTGCLNTVFVRFNATDLCGNSNFSIASFSISDTKAPVITTQARSNSTECTGLATPPAFTTWLNTNAGAVASDQCSSTVIFTNNFNSLVLPQFLCNTGISVTFNATDACGFSAFTTATFTITDSQAPKLITPAQGQTFTCDTPNIPSLFDTFVSTQGGAFANDTCTINVAWTSSVTVLPSTACGPTPVTFTASDLCAVNPKSVQTTAVFTITDTVKPVYNTVPQNVTTTCGGGTLALWKNWLSTQGNAVSSDNCATVLILSNNNQAAGPPAGCNATSVVIFSIADDCANKVSATASFTVIDNTAPVFNTNPQDVTVDCSSTSKTQYTTWLAQAGFSSIADDCNTFTVQNNGPAAINNGCLVSQPVAFTASDICKNNSTRSATFTIQDVLPPVVNSPALNKTVECDGAGNTASFTNWLSSAGGANITDLCSTKLAITNDFVNGNFIQSSKCASYAFVTFTANDGCSHTVSTGAYFTIIDTTAPKITKPAQSVTVACSNTSTNAFQAWLDSHANATAADDCSGPSGLIWSNNFGEQPLPQCGPTPVTFSVTDNCGLIATTSAVFTIFDNSPPTFNPPATSLQVECDGYGNVDDYDTWVSSNAGSVASDTCATSLFQNNTAPAIGPVGCHSVTVAFFAYDNCNNVGITSATFTVVDSNPPSISPPAQSVSYECNSTANAGQLQSWLNSNGGADAVDICSSVLAWTHTSARIVPLTSCNESTTVTFTVTDQCNKASTTVASFTIVDSTPPVITQNATDIAIECSAITRSQVLTWLTTHGNATATDSCTVVKWTNDFNLGEEQNSCSLPIPVTFTASDLCGNVANTTATLTLSDTTAPIFVNFPADVVLSCDECYTVNCTGTPIAVDACTPQIPVTYSDDVTIGPTVINCPGDHTIVRTFFAVDNCGNVANKSQTIIVQITHTSGPCNPEECPPCGDTNVCCKSPLPQVACNPVPCNPVACNPVACIRVSCTAVTAEDCGVNNNNGAAPAAPLPYGGNIGGNGNCDPIYIYIFDDDEHVGEVNYEYVYVEVAVNSASHSFASLLLVVLSIFALL